MHVFEQLRSYLVLVVLFILVPITGAVIVYLSWQAHREAALQAQQTALLIAASVSHEQEQSVAGTHVLLRALAQLPEVLNRDGERCNRFFSRVLVQLPRYANLGASTSEGDVFCSGMPAPEGANIADRPYFREALHNRRVAVNYIPTGRISGKPGIVVGYPILSGDAARGVVFASLDLQWLESMVVPARIPPGSVITVFDQTGTIVMRYPPDKGWIGKSLSASPLFQKAVQLREGVLRSDSPDGTDRLYGFTPLYRLASTTLFVAAGIPTSVAFAQSNKEFYRTLFGFLLACLMTVAITRIALNLFLNTKLEALVNAVKAIGDNQAETPDGALPKPIRDKMGRLSSVADAVASSLKRAGRTQADSAAMLVHDLRTPLQSILIAAALLRDGLRSHGQLENDSEGLLSSIAASCQSLTERVSNFLEFSRSSAVHPELDKTPTDLARLTESAAGKYLPLVREKKIEFEKSVQPDIPPIEIDAVRIDLVIGNLLSNAIKFSPEGGRIEIGARESGEWLEVWVKDSGPGISPDELDGLFSKYYRTASGRLSGQPGSGLGLAICKMFVEQHGGKILVESEIGRGSTFKIRLPKTPPTTAGSVGESAVLN